jgi:hypothetical protein
VSNYLINGGQPEAHLLVSNGRLAFKAIEPKSVGPTGWVYLTNSFAHEKRTQQIENFESHWTENPAVSDELTSDL